MGCARVLSFWFVIYCCVSVSMNSSYYNDYPNESNSSPETDETEEINTSYGFPSIPSAEEPSEHTWDWTGDSVSIETHPDESQEWGANSNQMTKSLADYESNPPVPDDEVLKLITMELMRHGAHSEHSDSSTKTTPHDHSDTGRHHHHQHGNAHGEDHGNAHSNHDYHKDHNDHGAHDEHDNRNSEKDHVPHNAHNPHDGNHENKDHEPHNAHNSHDGNHENKEHEPHKDHNPHKAHNGHESLEFDWEERFCKEAAQEEEEPFMVKDGSFHPRYEQVLGVGVYRLHARARSWAAARRMCELEGAQLAVPNSREEALALAAIHNRCPLLLPSHFNDYQYIGIHDDYNEGNWETVVGHPLNETGYMKWAFNQPDNAHQHGENCLTMNRQAEFNDVPCWVLLPFICEHI